MTQLAYDTVLGRDEIRARVAGLMPTVLAKLERMVAIPSIAFAGYPAEPMRQMAAAALRLFHSAGVDNARFLDVATGYPPLYGEVRGPEASPVVVLYCHYDVQPAPPEQGWTTDPWTATRKDDGRIYGRGAADDKAGLAIHLATLEVYAGVPPCTVRLVVEGMNETASNLGAVIEAKPELFDCDVFVMCDVGNLRVGEPTLTIAQRSDVAWDLGPPVRWRTDGPAHIAARRALEAAYGRPPGEAGSRGSVPLLQTMQNAVPEAEFVLWGPQDMARSRIHASDESVDPSEIERLILAQAFFLQELAGVGG